MLVASSTCRVLTASNGVNICMSAAGIMQTGLKTTALFGNKTATKQVSVERHCSGRRVLAHRRMHDPGWCSVSRSLEADSSLADLAAVWQLLSCHGTPHSSARWNGQQLARGAAGMRPDWSDAWTWTCLHHAQQGLNLIHCACRSRRQLPLPRPR